MIQAVDAVVDAVRQIRARIPSWQRALDAAQAEAKQAKPSWERFYALLKEGPSTGPEAAVTDLAERDGASQASTDPQLQALSARGLLGDHVDLLSITLTECDRACTAALGCAEAGDLAAVLAALERARTALAGAMQHALFLTFVHDLSGTRVGDKRSLPDYCAGWGLNAAQIQSIWGWLNEDPKEVGGVEVPIALDRTRQVAYRKANDGLLRVATALTPVWGAGLVFAATAALFALLRAADITKWPAAWGWKLLVLVLFVTVGALAHLGSRVLNVNYNNPIGVVDAGKLTDWLSLRWLTVLQMYIPVFVVVASLWGAGNIPTSFHALGTAVLAGYSADSLVRAAVSKLGSQAASKSPAAAPGSGATAAAEPTQTQPQAPGAPTAAG